MRIGKALQKRIDEVVKEKIDIVSYNPVWTSRFSTEARFLQYPNDREKYTKAKTEFIVNVTKGAQSIF